MIVKICGIKDVEETEYLNENNVDWLAWFYIFQKVKEI